MRRQWLVVAAVVMSVLGGCSADEQPASPAPAAHRTTDRSGPPGGPPERPSQGRSDTSTHAPEITTIAVAHRGAPADGMTENGLPALENAGQLDAEMSEFDVRPTLDGVPLVMHDGGLVRTTDCLGQVWGRTFADIRAHCRLDDGSPVPTLREFLDFSVTRGLPLMIELKEGPGWTPEVIAGMRADMEPLSQFRDSVFLSFDDRLLALAHDAIPELPGIWIVPRRLSTSRSVLTTPADGLLVDGELTTQEWMDGARRHHKLVYSRVVDTTRGWQVCVDLRLDGILTNRLADYLLWRAEAQG